MEVERPGDHLQQEAGSVPAGSSPRSTARSKMIPETLNLAGQNLSRSSYRSALAAVRGPASRAKIAQVHADRFSDHPELLGLVESLDAYEGSGVPTDGSRPQS
ncbi:hypothetical protein [Nonomuraea rubra]|uniref:hypothetical protein n=1 Tax=Nonomuraea rubra TaxID=46180 RepID=UPI0033F69040